MNGAVPDGTPGAPGDPPTNWERYVFSGPTQQFTIRNTGGAGTLWLSFDRGANWFQIANATGFDMEGICREFWAWGEGAGVTFESVATLA